MRHGFIGRSARFVSAFALGASLSYGGASADSVVVLTPDHGPSGSKVRVHFCITPNTKSPRSASISIDGKTFVVSQLPLAPCAQGVGPRTADGKDPLITVTGSTGLHSIVVELVTPGAKSYSVSQRFTIDPPLSVQNATIIGGNLVTGSATLTNPVTIHIDSITPNPGRPDEPARVEFTVYNNTANARDVDVTGHLGSQTLSGPGRHLTNIPAHGLFASHLQTFSNVPSGSSQVVLNATMFGGLGVQIGPNGQLQQARTTLGQASDSRDYSVLAGCVPQNVDPSAFASIINIVEMLDSLPPPYDAQYAAAGQRFQPIFGSRNHLDIARFVSNPPSWAGPFINRTWLSRRDQATTPLNGNTIAFSQSFDIHLDAVGMTWTAHLNLGEAPGFDGHAFNVRPQNGHLDLSIPEGDMLLLGALSIGLAGIPPDPVTLGIARGAAEGAKETLRGKLETMAIQQVGPEVGAGLAALLGNRFTPQDDAGRSRTTLGFAGPNITMNYCFPGQH